MAKLTRRSFLTQTSVGAATFGLLPAVPALAVTPDSSEAAAPELSAAAFTGPMIAHVRDVVTGEVALLVGTREIVFRDPQLVARLLNATR